MRQQRLVVDPVTGKQMLYLERVPRIITAAHCLPGFPPCHGGSHAEERTYQNLIGPLDEAPTVWAECLFVDPVADIAVLGEPDGQIFFDECRAHEKLIELRPWLAMADPPENPATAWLLSLDREWFGCNVEHFGGPWIIKDDLAQPIESGMSGSPILNHDRTAAIGVVCISNSVNPRLAVNLPAGMAPTAAPITAPPFQTESLQA